MSSSERKITDSHARILNNTALEMSRMEDANPHIVQANQGFGTVVMFRAGSNTFDAGMVRQVARKSTKDKDKIAPVGPAIGGIPRDKTFGKRKADKESFGELYKYSGNSEGDCYVPQVLPLCHLMDEFIKGTYVIVDPETGKTFSYVKPESQSEFDHLRAMQHCLHRIRITGQLHLKLSKLSAEYQSLADLNYVYKFNLKEGEKVANPNALLKATSDAAKEFVKNCLPDFQDKLASCFTEKYASAEDAADDDKYVPLEIYAKKIPAVDGSVKLVAIGTDEDRLANAVDPDMPVSKYLTQLIPDVDEAINGFDPETGHFAQDMLANEILQLEDYIATLEEKSAEDETVAKDVAPLLTAFRVIYKAMTEGDHALNDTMHAFIALIGCTTKREFFWQMYLNVMFHPESAYHFFIVQHGNENRNPGIPSEIDRTLIQGFTPGKAKLELSEESFVDTLLTEYPRLRMYVNPAWLHDDVSHAPKHDDEHKKEKKETITAYKAKGHIWGAVVLQKLQDNQPVEIETLIGFYHYLHDLDAKIKTTGAFASLPGCSSGGQLASFAALHHEHLILNSCVCIKEAMQKVSQVLAKTHDQLIEVFHADTELKLNEIMGLKPSNMAKAAVVLQTIHRKMKRFEAILEYKEFTGRSTIIEKTLAGLSKNLLKFPGNDGVRDQILKGSSSEAIYLGKIVSLLQVECKTLSVRFGVDKVADKRDLFVHHMHGHSIDSLSSRELSLSSSDSDTESEGDSSRESEGVSVGF